MEHQRPRYGGAYTTMAEGNTPKNIIMAREGVSRCLQGSPRSDTHDSFSNSGQERKRIENDNHSYLFKDEGSRRSDDEETDSSMPRRQMHVRSSFHGSKTGFTAKEGKNAEIGTDPEAQDLKKKETTSDVERLFQVFADLRINARPKAYTQGFVTGKDHDTRMSAEFQNERSTLEADSTLSTVLSDEKHSDDEDIVYCKNLLLKDRKDQFFLVVTPENEKIDMKKLKQQLGAHRNLSFADEGAMREKLKVEPGSVTPLALMHDSAEDVTVALHEGLKSSEAKLAFHPLDGSLQVEIHFSQLLAFLKQYGKVPIILDDSFDDVAKGVGISKGKAVALKNDVKKPKKQNEVLQPTLKNKVEVSMSTHLGTVEKNMKITEHRRQNEDTQQQQPFNNITEKSRELPGAAKIIDDTQRPKSDEENAGLREQSNPSYLHKQGSENSSQHLATNVGKGKGGLTWYNRKGKLRSYVKKLCKPKDAKEESSLTTNSSSGEEKSTDSKYFQQTTDTLLSNAVNTCASQQEKQSPDDKDAIKTISDMKSSLRNSSPKRLVPQVSDFLRSLQESKVSFRDLDLSCEAIGPSVGCRCFLLKDKKQHFFFVISHEFYEVDHGRLKKALRPRKKIDFAEPHEVVKTLGVDPTRITPFAYVTAPNKADFSIFITEKINDNNVVLCIQHPFAPGHRILMKSVDLKTYLKFVGAELSVVEERKWPPGPDTIFTQFNLKNGYALNGADGELRRNAEQNLEQVQHAGIKANHELSFTDSTNCHGQESNIELGFFQNDATVFRRMVGHFYGTFFAQIQTLFGFHVDLSGEHHNRLLSMESSVDPTRLTTCASPEDVSANRCTKVKDIQFGEINEQRLLNHEKKEQMPKEEFQPVRDSQKEQFMGNETIETPAAVPVDELRAHLEKFGVDFTMMHQVDRKPAKKGKTTRKSETALNRSKDDDKSRADEKGNACHGNNAGSGNDFTINMRGHKQNVSRQTLKESKNERSSMRETCPEDNEDDDIDADISDGEDEDNIEDCNIVHFRASSGQHYLVIGGKSDIISKRRFFRRFQMHKPLKTLYNQSEPWRREASEGKEGTHTLPHQLPFSFAIFNEMARSSSATVDNDGNNVAIGRHPDSNIKEKHRQFSPNNPRPARSKLGVEQDVTVVLTTSIYVDPDTNIRFQISTNSDQLLMKSEDFEDYVRKAGFHVWYL